MAIKPILFNTPMVRAVRSDIKTETRRLINPRYRDDEYSFQIITNAHTGEFVRVEMIDEWENCTRFLPPQYLPGDILWVRESWAVAADLPGISDGGFVYRSDYTDYELSQLKEKHFCWKPSIHMPKSAARTFIKVTGVWAERLQDITDEQCIREGIQKWSKDGKLYKYAPADGEGDYPMWPWQDTPIDMAEVVHCSECKCFRHVNQYYAQCTDSGKYFPLWKEDPSKHFCSWGERRNKNG